MRRIPFGDGITQAACGDLPKRENQRATRARIKELEAEYRTKASLAKHGLS